ncbi:preprotein translocase, Oxa1 family [Galdieria sulphuraria]|uniref:Preprotein translocase, Oxa1 family n=1 Tax=Galdieria sulphuraria TaxID=130081 RepID=M2X799_GALSU|nr:preprotein translocase, Oxa1 family [Galdieria sulphuraria]EME32365.1 preprotein translocase, Oxa1 family [Galdieria sulphuraria]|eukprot:XP_005708885.1 preprotein translocase, Oxa1 family [Galdieria sulphuraria]
MLWKTVLLRASRHWRNVVWLESFQSKVYYSKCRNLSTDVRFYGNNYLPSVAVRRSLYNLPVDRVGGSSRAILFCENMHHNSIKSEQQAQGNQDLTSFQVVDKEDTSPSSGGHDAHSNTGSWTDNSSGVDNVANSWATATQETVASDVATPSSAVTSNWYDPVISYLTYLHDSTDMPWWGLIVTCTVVVRFVMLPFTLIAMRNAAIMNTIQPRLKEIQDLMFDAKSRGKLDQAKQYQQEYMKVIKENDINPFRSMLGPLVQTPVFLAFFFGLRKMAETIPSFQTGGTSWFEDLSKPDPLFLMPTLCAGIFLLNLQLSLTTGATPTNKQWINVFRLFGLAIIPLTAKMPCAIFLLLDSQ